MVTDRIDASEGVDDLGNAGQDIVPISIALDRPAAGIVDDIMGCWRQALPAVSSLFGDDEAVGQIEIFRIRFS